MSGRWFVIKNDAQLGPYSPEEIREGLREGAFDPFDLVSREGSSIRQELLEVDEIFAQSQVAFKEGVIDSEVARARGRDAGVAPVRAAARESAEDAEHTVVSAVAAGRRASAGESPRDASRDAADRGDKRAGKGKADSKRFFLIDKRNRIVGPLSSAEVLGLYSKGQLASDVRVQKMNGSAQVSIDKFIQVYSTQKEAKQAPASPVLEGGLPSSRVMAQIARAAAVDRERREKLLIPALSLAFLIVALALVWVIIGVFRSGETEMPWGKDQAGKEPGEQVTEDVPPVEPDLSPATTKPNLRAPAGRRPSSSDKPANQWSGSQSSGGPSSGRASNRSQSAAPPTAPSSTVRPPQNSGQVGLPTNRRYTPPPTRSSQQNLRTSASPPATILRQTRAANPPARPSPGSGGFVVGTEITLSGVTFNKAALGSCPVRCRLQLNSPRGSITAVFFKGAFAPVLSAANGPVTVRGKIGSDASGKVLYLQDVR